MVSRTVCLVGNMIVVVVYNCDGIVALNFKNVIVLFLIRFPINRGNIMSLNVFFVLVFLSDLKNFFLNLILFT